MYKKKIIQVPPANIDKLASYHRCSRQAVYNALSFNTHSDLAQLIRKDALESYGGITTTKTFL